MLLDVPGILTQHHIAIQTRPYTCGPACILNILHLKSDFSQNEIDLASLCNAQPKIGTSHEDLVRGAEAAGLTLTEQREGASVDDIENALARKTYVIVNYLNAFSGNGHYAVVTGYDTTALYCIDPFYGLMRMEKELFVTHWRSKDGVPRWYAAFR